MGVANQRSIAWGIASAFRREGAEVAFTYQNDRLKENLDELLETIGGPSTFPTFPCDVQNDEHLRGVFEGLRDRWGRLDAVAHCIAFANRDDLSRPFHEISRSGYALALDISAYSLIAVAHAAAGGMGDGGGSIFTPAHKTRPPGGPRRQRLGGGPKAPGGPGPPPAPGTGGPAGGGGGPPP